jgi:hypothetical protein
MMHTLRSPLGPQLIQARRVEDLDKDRFAMGALLGKRLFVDNDVWAGARLSPASCVRRRARNRHGEKTWWA